MKLYIAAFNASIFITSFVVLAKYLNDRLILNVEWVLIYVGFFTFMFALIVIATRVLERFTSLRKNK